MNTAQTRLSEMEGYVQHATAPPEEGRGAILEKMHDETAWVRRLARAYAVLAAAADGGAAAAGPPSRKRQRQE